MHWCTPHKKESALSDIDFWLDFLFLSPECASLQSAWRQWGPKHNGSQKIHTIMWRSLDFLLCPHAECTKGHIRARCRLEAACSVLTWLFLSSVPIHNHLKRLFSGLEKRREKQRRENQPSVPASRPLISLPEGLLYGSRHGVKAQCAAVLLARGFAVCEAFSCQEY